MANACPDGSHQDVRRMPRRNNWTLSSDEALVDLLLDESTQSGVLSGSFKPEAWLRIWNLYQKITKEDTTLLQLKGRWKTLKKLYKLYASLIAKSGWSWDLDSQKPTPGNPTVWEEIIKVNREYKVCRDKSFPLYPKIHDLVASSTATGEYACHTGVNVRTDNVVHDLEESSGSSDSPVVGFAKETTGPSVSKRKQVAGPSKQASKRKSSEKSVEALHQIIELSDRRSKYLENKKAATDRFSYATCMDKLSAMPGLSPEELFVAGEVLSSHEQKGFLPDDATSNDRVLVESPRDAAPTTASR